MTDLSDIQTAIQSYIFQEEDMKTKALVMDIDGTLTNSRKEITPATGRAIRTILERGHKVVLASGRPTFGMRRYAEELELDRFGG